MYRMQTVVLDALGQARALARPPFGPGFTPDDLAGATVMEVWGTELKDSGDDYVEFRLIHDGTIIKTRRVIGY